MIESLLSKVVARAKQDRGMDPQVRWATEPHRTAPRLQTL